MRRCIPHNALFFAVLQFPLFLFASTTREIVIESASTANNIASVKANIGSVHFQLTCSLSEPGCLIPKPGKYRASEALKDEAIYEDCHNIHLYGRSGDGKQERLVGTFCLLGVEATSVLIAPNH